MVIDKQCHQLLAAGLVDLVKALDQRAVEVEHTRHLPAFNQWHNELGARGIGEIGLAGIAAAITDAVHHATGVRVRELPVKIENLLA